jgi:hypothetical protein
MRTLAIMTVVLCAACGTDSVALDDYPAAIRDAGCRYLAKCGLVEDLDTCRKINVGDSPHFSASGRAAIDMGKTRYDGEHAQSCLDALAARSCDVTSESYRVLPDACREIIAGTQHAGAACALDAECISLSCDVPGGCNMACCTGTCTGDTAPARSAKLGESCETASCDATSFCDDGIMTCVALKPADAFCVSPDECAFGLDCAPSGVCAALPAPGAACTGACRDEGTTCSATSRTCVNVALSGEACTTSSDCSAVYRCDATKHCSAGPALGAACTAAQRCGDDRAFCDVPQGQPMGTCVLPKPDGSQCQRDGNCESRSCDQATMMCGPEPVCI